MIKLKNKLNGAIQTIFVPFNKKREIDFVSLKKHIDYLCNLKSVSFLYLMPYNGRYSQLSEKEIFKLNEFCIKNVKKYKNKYIIVSDPIHASTDLKLKFCLHAKKKGADVFSSICREKYFSNDQIFLHYKKLSKVNMPILVHVMPFLSGYSGQNYNWPPEIFAKLSKIKNIIAIKEDTKNFEYGKKILKKYKNRFKIIFAARKSLILKLHSHGLESYLNGSSVVDSSIDEIFLNYLNLNHKIAKKFINEIDDPFWNIIVKKYGWHRVNKSCLETNKIMKRYERLPMVSLNRKEFNELKKFVFKLKKKLNKWKKIF